MGTVTAAPPLLEVGIDSDLIVAPQETLHVLTEFGQHDAVSGPAECGPQLAQEQGAEQRDDVPADRPLVLVVGADLDPALLRRQPDLLEELAHGLVERISPASFPRTITLLRR
jgi:hypothetical protein